MRSSAFTHKMSLIILVRLSFVCAINSMCGIEQVDVCVSKQVTIFMNVCTSQRLCVFVTAQKSGLTWTGGRGQRSIHLILRRGTGKQATTACTNTHHPDPHSPNILGPHAGFSSEPGDHYKYSLWWRLSLPFDLFFVSEEPADGLSLHLHSTRFGCSDNLLGNQTWRDKEGLASTKSEWYQWQYIKSLVV